MKVQEVENFKRKLLEMRRELLGQVERKKIYSKEIGEDGDEVMTLAGVCGKQRGMLPPGLPTLPPGTHPSSLENVPPP